MFSPLFLIVTLVMMSTVRHVKMLTCEIIRFVLENLENARFNVGKIKHSKLLAFVPQSSKVITVDLCLE